eukprot:CAMPEP_0206139342 /NCGR_PEP_ID=MMETSP1473-20131121/5544_1 /ASSEMBLY_ACC=CAM_ASM_001109 /TAXON_ID=1461547 /ORGANISM="Stichococcus sp, Strain RCC1054" /LENGTH=890 /DNA_ID=CAMNT_0053533095 /DNA_START=451 /DNA_END=3123 /DNA_ORIENTATION=-
MRWQQQRQYRTGRLIPCATPRGRSGRTRRRGSNDEAEDTSDEEDDVDAAADDEQEAEYEEFSDEDEELVADQEDLAYDEPETEDEDEDFSEEDSYDDDEYDSEEEEDAEEAVFSDDDFDGIEGLPKLKGGLDLDEPSEDDLRELEEEMGDDDLGFGDLGFEDAVQELLADEARQPIDVINNNNDVADGISPAADTSVRAYQGQDEGGYAANIMDTAQHGDSEFDSDQTYDEDAPLDFEKLMRETFSEEDIREIREEALRDSEDDEYPAVPYRTKTLGQLFELAGLCDLAKQLTSEQLAVEVSNIEWDPRKVYERTMFVCMDAIGWDGHDFTECCVGNGAVAIVVERDVEHDIPEGFPVIRVDDTIPILSQLANAFYDFPSEELVTVGVTGDTGKTTTTWLIRGIFEELSQLTGMIGSVEYAISTDRLDDDGDLWVPIEEDTTLERDTSRPDHVAPYEGKYTVTQSTPNGLNMHKILAGIRDRGAQSAVIEATTTGLQEGRLNDVDLDVAVFTNCNDDHLMTFEGGIRETQKQHCATMATMFARLNDPDRQRAVVNIDDPFSDQIRQAGINVPVVTYGITNREADVRAEKYTLTAFQTNVIISTPLGRLEIKSSLIGLHNLYNILAAVAVGVATGVNLKAIVLGIEAVDQVPGRTELIDEGQDFPVIVDCANNPKSLLRLLQRVRQTEPRRILTVFGAEGGHTSKEMRAQFGYILDAFSDYVFLTNNNPRTENAATIVQETVAGYREALLKYDDFPGMQNWMIDINTITDPPSDHVTRDRRIATQGLWRRFVIHDRFNAIRVAIATAQERDVVIIAGKGNEDFQEYHDENGQIVRGWFDDRVEARNALSKLPELNQYGLDRTELPWCFDPSMERPNRMSIMMDVDVREFKY